MQRKWVVLMTALALLMIGAAGGYYYHKYKYNKYTGPGSKVILHSDIMKVILENAKKSKNIKIAPLSKTPVVLEGKLEEVRNSDLDVDKSTRIVLISNNGELVMLFNPGLMNNLRFGYVGNIVSLSGTWGEGEVFRGKKYRSLWCDGVKVIQDLSKLKKKTILTKAKSSKRRR